MMMHATHRPDAGYAIERVVRFEETCVLIPELQKRRAGFVTKSYSLPLWKRGAKHLQGVHDPAFSPENEEGYRSPSIERSPSAPIAHGVYDGHVVLTVSLPR